MTMTVEHGGSARLAGIACGVGAGALWGLVFLAPELAEAFPPLWLAAGRYLAFGVISAVLIAPRLRTLLPKIGRREWLGLFWLALTGNTLYFVLLAQAVQSGGIAMTSLIIGFLPVAVTLMGSRHNGAAPLVRLIPSLLLCTTGVLAIGWQAIAAPADSPLPVRALGLVCAVGALASWTAFAVLNRRWLTRLGDVSVHDWNLLNGLMTGAQALVLLPLALVLERGGHSGGAWVGLVGISVGVAVVASFGGNLLWNRMSRLLPLTLVGQMILFETLFALLYGFLWEQRWPTPLESTALVCLVLSVVTSVSAHRSRRTVKLRQGPAALAA